MSDTLHAIILGIVEGVTEFLPISSTGHLILTQHLLGLRGAEWEAFEVMIQLGAILAVVVLYFRKLWSTLIGLPTDPKARHFAALILVALLPSLVLGALFAGTIKTLLFSPAVVGITLIIGGIVILLVEHFLREPKYFDVDQPPLLTGLLIGLAQTVSMIPGTSRSAATIIGGLLLGLDRKTAAEFSFFLAIPTMTAAFVHEAWGMRNALSFDSAGSLAVGFVTSFIAALLVIKPFLAIIGRSGFAPFAYYRIALGALVLALLYT